MSNVENDKVLLTKDMDVLMLALSAATAQTQQLEQNILGLESEVDDFRSSSEILTKERQKHIAQLNANEESLSRHNHDLLEAQQKCTNLLEKVEKLTSENSELLEKISCLDSCNECLATHISELEDRKNSMVSKYKSFENESNIKDKQIVELRQQLDKLHQLVDDERVASREELSGFKNKIEVLTNSLNNRDMETALQSSEHQSALVALEEQMRKQYEELNTQYTEKYLTEVTLAEEKRHASELEVKQFYEDKVATLEEEKIQFENHQKQIYEERIKQLDQEKICFENHQKQICEERIKQLDQEKIQFENHQKQICEERIKQLDQEKIQFECSQLNMWEEKLKELEEKRTNYEAEMNIYKQKEHCFEDEKAFFLEQIQELEVKVTSLEDKKEEMTAEYERMVEELSLMFEQKIKKIEDSNKEVKTELTQKYNEEIATIKNEKEEQMKEQQQKWKEQLQLIEEDKRNSQQDLQMKYNDKIQALDKDRAEVTESLQQIFCEKIQLIEKEKEDYVKQQEEIWTQRERILDVRKISSEKEIEMKYEEMLNCLKEKMEKEELKQIKLNEEFNKLEKENDSLRIMLKEQMVTFENQIKAEKDRQLQHDSNLLEIKRLQLEKETLQLKHVTLESKYHDLASENKCLSGRMELLQDEIYRVSEEYEVYQTQQRVKYTSLTEAADREKDGLSLIISEMSEKIQQMEEGREETGLEQHWKSMYEELEKRMQPFKEILDAYELEKKLLQDRDRYTNEKIEKLTKEAIENMGHKNHRQKVKYMEKLKQEHIALQNILHDTKEELQRQNAAVRKYQERLEKYEGTKEVSLKKTPSKPTPVKPRAPLKDGNR